MATLTCPAIFVSWVALALVKLWFATLGDKLFLMLTVTAGALLVFTIVLREQTGDSRLCKYGYLDDSSVSHPVSRCERDACGFPVATSR